MHSADPVTSSPQSTRCTIFSEQPTHSVSPASSPPGFPWDQQGQQDPPQKPATSAFSLLGKRKPLSDASGNARKRKRAATASAKHSVGKIEQAELKSLTQMQISVGQTMQKRCKTCGMEYVLSSEEDRKLHIKYHDQNTLGYDTGRDFLKTAPEGTVFKTASAGDFIAVVGPRDSASRKRRARAVLDIVQRELGAVEIPDRDLWASDDRYTNYLYIRGRRCVGFLLVKRIQRARKVCKPKLPVNTRAETDSAATSASALSRLKAKRQAMEKAVAASVPFELSKEDYPASLGISRVWVSPNHRQQAIAITLLDTAIIHHHERARAMPKADESGAQNLSKALLTAPIDLEVSGILPEERKEKVAFSQPTEAGTRLARKWLGRAWNWLVYSD